MSCSEESVRHHDAPLSSWFREHLCGQSGAGLTVGMIDSGWNRRIVDSRVRDGCSIAVTTDRRRLVMTLDDTDRIGHGTDCTSLVLRVAPRATVLPVRVFDTTLEAAADVIAAAIDIAVANSAQVLNLSLSTRSQRDARLLHGACERARRNGVIVVASADRDGAGYPAEFDNVLGVRGGAVFEPYAYEYSTGASIECLASDTLHSRVRGTTAMVARGSSFAAAVISGIVTLILERHPGANLDDIRRWLADHQPTPASGERLHC